MSAFPHDEVKVRVRAWAHAQTQTQVMGELLWGGRVLVEAAEQQDPEALLLVEAAVTISRISNTDRAFSFLTVTVTLRHSRPF